MKRTVLFTILILLCCMMRAQTISVDEYINTYKNLAISEMKRSGIPASVILAQGILEIGTFTGFSALCLAKGLQAGGLLHTIELREDDADSAKKYFKQANAENIILHIGDAKDIIPALKEEWDLVFIDADKVSYIDYYELTLPQLKPGGFMLADNVLFHGQVLEANITGKNATAIHAFNEHVAKDKRTEQVMLSVRDGITMIRKKEK